MNEEKENEIIINKNSTDKAVALFLKIKLKFSQKTIDHLDLDGSSFLMLSLEELTKEERHNLIKFSFDQSKKEGDNYFCRLIFNLLFNKELIYSDLKFQNEEEKKIFQKNILSNAKSKEEINFFINLLNGLINKLILINNNLSIIWEVLEKNASYFENTKNNYLLNLGNLSKEDDDIDVIYKLLSQILFISKKKTYKIIDLKKLFNNMIDFYKDKNLNKFCQLHNIVGLLKIYNISTKSIEIFYNILHQKGMELIKNKILTNEEIFNFIFFQDIYYFNPIFKNSNNRDPEIFRYISITDIDKNYLENIKKIKENKLWSLFSEQNSKMKFYGIILEQMKKLKDFKSIFDIFPIREIDTNFVYLINAKINGLRYEILGEEDKNYNLYFKIFDNWFICNYNNKLGMQYLVNSIELDYDITIKYYFHLLKDKNMQFIKEAINCYIIIYFSNYIKKDFSDPEIIISFLLLVEDKSLIEFYLNEELNHLILRKEDFFAKEENKSYLLFKLFFQKIVKIEKNSYIQNTKYFLDSLKIKSEIIDDLKSNKLKYDLVNNLIDENDTFYKKILAINDKEIEAIVLYNNLKINFKICNIKIKQMENILNYYNLFYKNYKKHLIDIIKEKIKDIKQKNINELVLLFNIVDDGKFNIDEEIVKSQNIKYKDSIFFMSIYNNLYKNKKLNESEDLIFQKAINNFKDIFNSIIGQRCSKIDLLKLGNINEIIKEIKNPRNNLKLEMNFIEKEFVDLGKDDYIKNNLLKDLINFSKIYDILKLLCGIICFIDLFNKIKTIEKTELFNNLKEAYKNLISDEINEKKIENTINSLNNNSFNINNQDSEYQFYESLLDKKESILFINFMKNSLINVNDLNLYIDDNKSNTINQKDIENLKDILLFFDKLTEIGEIKTDRQLIKILNKELGENKNFIIKFKNYLNK